MSETPPANIRSLNGRDKTPELTSTREKRHHEDAEDDRDRTSRQRHRRRDDDERDHDRDRDPERERRHRHRHRDEDHDEERRERRRRHHDNETEEEREERRRRRKERDREMRDRDREEPGHGRGASRDDGVHERRHRDHRDRSRDSHRSHRSHRSRDIDPSVAAAREMSREEKERERERRDREMMDERREAARIREERFADMDRERERERRISSRPQEPDYNHRSFSSPRRRRASPTYGAPPPPREPPPVDPTTQLLNEVDSESRSVFVSQLAARMTSQDLGMFFEDKLGRGSVKEARIVTDRGSRRSKGIGYVELDNVPLVNRALGLSGSLVMGIPIGIQLTEAERNRQGQVSAIMSGGFTTSTPRPVMTFGGPQFPPLSTGLQLPAGMDPDAHKDAAIPYHRLHVSNLAFSLSPEDVRAVFESFGDIEFTDMHFNFSGESKGTAYVQFKELRSAQMALDAMNNFELAGRPIRVQTVSERSNAPEQIEETGHGPRMDATQRQQLMFKLARTEPSVNLSLSAKAPPPAKPPISMSPTYYLIITNMFNPEEETERNWDLDLAEDIKGEVEGKYGKIRRIKVDKMSSAGEVYVEFDSVGAAQAAVKGLNGRFFGGRQLQVSFVTETLFKMHM